jgi:hypothetical protein
MEPRRPSSRKMRVAVRTYDRVHEVLTGYLSPLLVESTLARALDQRRLSANSLGPEDLQNLIADCMVGLRLFVEPQRLPELMVKLTELLGEEA